MNFSSQLIEDAVNQLAKLPGIGKKTALRLVLNMLKRDASYTEGIVHAISQMRNNIKFCSQCHNISDNELCNICSSTMRNNEQICVVENIQNVMAIENTNQFSGLYHVLGGLISPIDGIGPEALKINSLIERVNQKENVELIMALNATIEGETTTFYINKQLKNTPCKISIIARGVAFGGELEYADELTLGRSIVTRQPYENQLVSNS